MPRNYYKYQYETSPRKLEPEYTPPVNPYKGKKTTAKKPEVKENTKAKKKNKYNFAKNKTKTVIYLAIGFSILFTISYRNTKINENFTEMQNLKKSLATIQKENEQLEVNIENSMNLNNVEQEAKKRLGMQMLSNSQKVYVTISKKDYIQPADEEVMIIKEEEQSIFERILNKMMNIFN